MPPLQYRPMADLLGRQTNGSAGDGVLMLVLGIDCGSRATGYGLVASDGRRHRAVAFGTIVLSPRIEPELAQRLHRVHSALSALMQEHQPQAVAIEEAFYSQNVRTALLLSHVRGVAMQAAAAQGITVAEYSPLEVKSAVTGYGRAEKHQVLHMICSLLDLTEAPDSLDASDALAVAICHIHSHGAATAR